MRRMPILLVVLLLLIPLITSSSLFASPQQPGLDLSWNSYEGEFFSDQPAGQGHYLIQSLFFTHVNSSMHTGSTNAFMSVESFVIFELDGAIDPAFYMDQVEIIVIGNIQAVENYMSIAHKNKFLIASKSTDLTTVDQESVQKIKENNSRTDQMNQFQSQQGVNSIPACIVSDKAQPSIKHDVIARRLRFNWRQRTVPWRSLIRWRNFIRA